MPDPSPLKRQSHDAKVDSVRPLEATELDRRLLQSDLGLRVLATVIELLTSLDTQKNLPEASGSLAGLVRKVLSANHVLVFWRNHHRARLALIGGRESGFPTDSTSERLAMAAAEEGIARRGFFHWRNRGESGTEMPPGDRIGSLALQQFARASGVGFVSGVPLQSAGQDACGVILVLADEKNDSEELLEAISEPVAHKFASIEAIQPTWLEKKIRVLHETFSGRNRRVLTAIGIVLFTIGMLPVTYRVPANIELQAEQRRFIAVPFDGPLRSTTVRPGDVVREGDLLAEIDPRELEYELSGINAELEKVLQEKKAKLVERDVAGSQMAGLDSQRLRSKADLLMLRRQNLEIRSPITGVIVSGDLESSWGMPMMRGDTLFEVAPLEVMQVDMAIPESEIRHVRQGMQVDFFLDALPSRALQGTVSWIHPRAELVDNENVFIARMELANPDLLYRPGMHGRARIQSDRHPLIWNYLHKPFHALRHAMGW